VREDGQGAATGNAPWIGEALHDLCQPLTALECGLYIGTISPDGVRAPTPEELLETIQEALRQCERLATGLRVIQDRTNRESLLSKARN